MTSFDSQILSENELNIVSGGTSPKKSTKNKVKMMKIACCKCKKPFWANIEKDEAKCPSCQEVNVFAG